MPDTFDAFLAQVRSRLERGREVFADRSLERTGPELLSEVQEELADVAGWSALLWSRLERLRAELQRVDPGPDHGTAVRPLEGDAALDAIEAEIAADELDRARLAAATDATREHAIAVLGGRPE